MAPWPAGTASCIYFPRARTSFTAAEKSTPPAATSAEYSPRLWPGDEIRDDSPLFERAIGCSGNRQNGRLRIFGELQRFFGTFEAEFA